VIDPLFWLGLSILLVAASLTAVLVAAIPALQELARAARSAEKLFDTLYRELPPTLDAIRMTSLEITDLTDDVSEGVKSANQVVKQVDQSLDSARKQAQNVQTGTRSFIVGVQTAWKTFTRSKSSRRTVERLSPSQKAKLTLQERQALRQENRFTPAEGYRTHNNYNDYKDYNEAGDWENSFDEQDSHRQTESENWSDKE
jgi:ABC-type transporter Mla subunit MlaD